MNDSTIEPELNSLRTKLVAEIDNDLKQVEALKKKISKNESLLQAVKASLGVFRTDSDNAGYGTKRDIIRSAIERISKHQFTQNDVEMEIRRNNPEMDVNRDRIRAALWTMASKGNGIKQISKGNNQQQAIYEKVVGNSRNKRGTEEDNPQALRNSESLMIATPINGPLSANTLEESVRLKSGRIDQVAARFRVDTQTIAKFLKPHSKVYMAHAGWLKVDE